MPNVLYVEHHLIPTVLGRYLCSALEMKKLRLREVTNLPKDTQTVQAFDCNAILQAWKMPAAESPAKPLMGQMTAFSQLERRKGKLPSWNIPLQFISLPRVYFYNFYRRAANPARWMPLELCLGRGHGLCVLAHAWFRLSGSCLGSAGSEVSPPTLFPGEAGAPGT